ncbi:MAG: transglutaminase-like cysteine peptidase [Dongia sp.]
MKGVDLLRAVNDAFNDDLRYPYITDKENWGRDDYWATPYQFLERSGDCEDYAVAKYMALEQLGVADEDMMILSVKLRVRPDIAHAILIVFIGNDGWVLDILNKHVMPQSAAQVLYEPLMAVNTKLWMYLHGVT